MDFYPGAHIWWQVLPGGFRRSRCIVTAAVRQNSNLQVDRWIGKDGLLRQILKENWKGFNLVVSEYCKVDCDHWQQSLSRKTIVYNG